MQGFGHLLTAMVTPFKEGGAVDYDKAAELASRLLDCGSDGIVVSGTTGESPTLTFDEMVSLFNAVVEAVGGRGVVVAGTGSYCTQETIELTKTAEKVGVDGIMLVTPYYNKPPQSALYSHFKMIAAETELPIMLYNVPSRTSVNLLPETVARLAEIENIVAIKEASGNLGQVARIYQMTPDDFYIYSGDDNLTLPVLSVGGVGVVSVAAHVVGHSIREMIDLFLAGKVKEAAEVNRKLVPLFEAMFVTTNPIPVKTAVNLLGGDVGSLRPPLQEPSAEQVTVIKEALKKVGLIDF